MFHFNWGWNGSYKDNWFTLDDLNPDGTNYDSYQTALFYLRPGVNQDYCDFDISLLDHYNRLRIMPFTQLDLDNIPRYPTRLTSAYPATINGYTVPSSWYTIASGETRKYFAHEAIFLEPGFDAQSGSIFVARIEPCTNCNSAKVTLKSTGDDGSEIEEEIYISVGDNDEDEQQQPLDRSEIPTDELYVYPNPTTGLLTIETNINSHIKEVELYNAQGVKIFTLSSSQSFFQEIDISHFPSQIYILKINVDGLIFTKKTDIAEIIKHT